MSIERRFRQRLEDDPEFREAWQKAVRDGADRSAGQVAHWELSGASPGVILAEMSFSLPVPDGFSVPAVTPLFISAVEAECRRRLSVMHGGA